MYRYSFDNYRRYCQSACFINTNSSHNNNTTSSRTMEKIVYDDCWKLLRYFGSAADKCLDAKFELFCKTWHELQMHHIYTAQTNYIEVIETTLAALHVAKRVACGRSTSGEKFEATRAQRIGAIYLMYAIFNKQPTKKFIKIEVSPGTWQALTGYIEHLRRQQTDRSDTQQVSYIFWRLVYEQAFRFTALDYCHALDSLAAYDSVEILAESKKHMKNSRDTVLNQQLKPTADNLKEQLQGLEQMTDISHSLRQLEAAYNKQMEPHRSSFPVTNIFSQLNDVLIDINKSLMTDKESSTVMSGSSEQLHTRRSIRKKAMFDNSREKQPILEANEEQEQQQKSSHARNGHVKRMSAATVFKSKLPDDVIRDLER